MKGTALLLREHLDYRMAVTGETLTSIAHNAGISRYSLDRWRKFPERVPPHKVQRLAEALGYQDWRELTIKPPSSV